MVGVGGYVCMYVYVCVFMYISYLVYRFFVILVYVALLGLYANLQHEHMCIGMYVFV